MPGGSSISTGFAGKVDGEAMSSSPIPSGTAAADGEGGDAIHETLRLMLLVVPQLLLRFWLWLQSLVPSIVFRGIEIAAAVVIAAVVVGAAETPVVCGPGSQISIRCDSLSYRA